jgi:hypothetical protein
MSVAPAESLTSEEPVSTPGVSSTSSSSPAPPREVTEAVQTTNETLAVIAHANQQTQQALEQSGIKIAPATLKEEAKGMEASMLSALRIALFEFYMYNGTDRNTLLSAMSAGGVTDSRDVAKRYGAATAETGGTAGALKDVGTKPVVLGPTARGGMVTGIASGIAVVAAQGEGLASVGRGERITPASGGAAGGGVHVSVNGIGGPDLARLIEGKVVEGIREYKRREKFN